MLPWVRSLALRSGVSGPASGLPPETIPRNRARIQQRSAEHGRSGSGGLLLGIRVFRGSVERWIGGAVERLSGGSPNPSIGYSVDRLSDPAAGAKPLLIGLSAESGDG